MQDQIKRSYFTSIEDYMTFVAWAPRDWRPGVSKRSLEDLVGEYRYIQCGRAIAAAQISATIAMALYGDISELG